ncbi:MAG: DUF2066 domain-containing protein [Magnetococcales bacterium]|nr:DUF2066 domain-containing protein [Magnetococcales bacterium]
MKFYNRPNTTTLATWSLLLVVLLSLSLPKPASASVFVIEGIEINMSLPLPNNQIPRNVGLERAEDRAFTILFNRMLTRVNQDFNRDFLETIRREKKKFIERSVVRSERRRPRTFQITVDVTFSKKEVSEAFARAGIAHNQSDHPHSLLVIKAPTKSSHDEVEKVIMQLTKDYGISLSLPLGDMDDMMNLTWDRAVAADPQFFDWVKSRYNLEQMWAVMVTMETADGQSTRLPFYTANANLIEITKQGNFSPIQARNGGSFASIEQAQTTLFPALIDQLLWQVSSRWISNNAVEPVLRHTIPLRIVHNYQHVKYEKFLKEIQLIPGFSGFTYQSMTAQEVVIHIDYQGRDHTFLTAIAQLGVQSHPSPVGIVVYIQ